MFPVNTEITLIGPLFLPLCILLLVVFVAWKVSNRNSNILVERENEKYSKATVGLSDDLKELSNDLNQEKLEAVEDKKRKKAKEKSKKTKGSCCKDNGSDCSDQESGITEIKIYYASVGGKAKLFSDKLAEAARKNNFVPHIINLSEYEPEDKLPNEKKCCNAFIISTYEEGKPPPAAEWFCKWLEEYCTEFRVHRGLLKNVKYAVFGLGNSFYIDNFNKVAINVDKWLQKLQGSRLKKVYLGDENVSNSKNGSIENDFSAWTNELLDLLEHPENLKLGCKCSGKKQGGNCKSNEDDSITESSDDEINTSSNKIIDVEDLGQQLWSSKKSNNEVKDMVTDQLMETLSKQGYKIVGSHSGVKLCRWTKSMLRGRGGCYKHTFYGIESHRCMEATPSLACANKCVFCWRHHSNPVGTEWKWNMDTAEYVLNGVLENHYKMINQFKGVPGVSPDRLKEGMEARHCALSLVGEPIMYPEINKFVNLLHEKEISSFLVTNAQFPDAIKNLVPVTQLYVSVDASTKDSLKKIDRPLFKDFWERFIQSLKALAEKGQRTVYRLTLVKAWNVEEIQNYAELVTLGKPDFIEIKGVTYCGTSKASNLTMENVPWHEEVVSFGEKLCSLLENYKIASEHEHSNCILIAKTKFLINGKWHTWIDYDRFHSLVKLYKSSNGQKTFTTDDYIFETPSWAVFGCSEQGFDPAETRWRRKK
ncbi:hypothetical protein RUM44_008474 [Polyplax serrata]|uniref:tRNA 4-demethylwyosine synthase (AdoMet-dependent) n=1 Tax=Polyplax serrata TaxID=468196 RepID=A0ABR1BA92_POLSC